LGAGDLRQDEKAEHLDFAFPRAERLSTGGAIDVRMRRVPKRAARPLAAHPAAPAGQHAGTIESRTCSNKSYEWLSTESLTKRSGPSRRI
jgi:hypothetical protein